MLTYKLAKTEWKKEFPFDFEAAVRVTIKMTMFLSMPYKSMKMDICYRIYKTKEIVANKNYIFQ